MSNQPLLTDEQRLAADTLDSPVTLIAAAGSGKTTVLVERYLRLLSRGYEPHQILTMTFTNEAAHQLRDRIVAALRAKEKCPAKTIAAVENSSQIGTIHSFCYSILDNYGSALELVPIEKIVSPFEFASTFDRFFEDWIENLESLPRLLGYYEWRELRGLAKEFIRGRHILKKFIPFQTEETDGEPLGILYRDFQPLVEKIEKHFVSQGAYTFGDLEYFTQKIFTKSPDIVKRMQDRIKFLLVDEFQDTSYVQWEILKQILGSDHKKLFVVGDPKQSIYSFRQAEVRIFLDVAEELRQKGGCIQELTTNFRAHPKLLDKINTLGKTLFKNSEIPFSEMRSGITRDTGSLQIYRYEETKNRSDLYKSEIKAVVDELKNKLSSGSQPSDIAILFRVSDRIGHYFEAINEAGIPVSCKRTGRLFHSYDVIDISHYLKTIEDPLNDFHMASFLKSSFVGWTNQDLWNLCQEPGNSLFERLMKQEKLEWFFRLIEKGVFSTHDCLKSLFTHSLYWPKQADAFMELLSALSEHPYNISESITQMESWEKEDIHYESRHRSGKTEAIQLMTIHSAKGLEFPHVFLVDNLRLSSNKTPIIRFHQNLPPALRFRKDGEMTTTDHFQKLEAIQSGLNEEEARRILYVALTRAEQSLGIFLPQNPKLIPKNSWGIWLEESLSA